MSDTLAQLVKKYRAYYEVLPYYVVLEERHGNLPATSRRIQAGFDIGVYGVAPPENQMKLPGADPGYAVSYAELKKIADEIASHATDECAVQVITFPSAMVLNIRASDKVEGMILIRVCHYRGLDQPVGPQEQRALEEIEKQLKSLGLVRS